MPMRLVPTKDQPTTMLPRMARTATPRSRTMPDQRAWRIRAFQRTTSTALVFPWDPNPRIGPRIGQPRIPAEDRADEAEEQAEAADNAVDHAWPVVLGIIAGERSGRTSPPGHDVDTSREFPPARLPCIPSSRTRRGWRATSWYRARPEVAVDGVAFAGSKARRQAEQRQESGGRTRRPGRFRFRKIASSAEREDDDRPADENRGRVKIRHATAWPAGNPNARIETSLGGQVNNQRPAHHQAEYPVRHSGLRPERAMRTKRGDGKLAPHKSPCSHVERIEVIEGRTS